MYFLGYVILFIIISLVAALKGDFAGIEIIFKIALPFVIILLMGYLLLHPTIAILFIFLAIVAFLVYRS